MARLGEPWPAGSHWDTEKALDCMHKEPYDPPATMALLSEQEGVRMDRVVDFPRFHVERTRLAPGTQERPASAAQPQAYRLLFVTQGSGRIVLADESEWPLSAGDACLLPASLSGYEIHAGYRQGLTYLMGHPRPANAP